ncbi:aldo/keto reductase [Phenylobacterium sp. LjRoot219]|uniref:aldo/keto reductase n=1 Tax=Phenylobacterium sp. LjRoot219 TaxID=3342283 RepID=UPI003ECF3B02
MQYATLGNTGLVVSRLGFGALTFTQGNQTLSTVYKVGAGLADELVGRALDAGVNFFDTADVYADGESEVLLGQALKPHRDKVVITTKVGNRGTTDRELLRTGLSKRHILWSVDQSLKRLGTDWIDFYVAHREDPFTPLEETLEAFDAVVRAGKVRHIGFSNWSAWTVSAAMEIQKARGLTPFTHGQMYYSLLGRDVERDIVPMMQRYGLGMTVWSPLAFGFLSGAYSREDLTKPDNRFSSFDPLGIDKEKGFAVIEVMRRIAAARAITVPQVAIAWLLARPGVTSVLIGATKMHQLDDNLGAADVRLTDEDMAELNEATKIDMIYATSAWIEPDRKVTRALGR